MKLFLTFLVSCCSLFANASQNLAVSGRLLDNQNTPVTESGVTFKLSVKINSCIAYQEEAVLDLSSSQGFFEMPMGTGTITFAGSPNVYGEGTINCQGGGTLVVTSSSVRQLQVFSKRSSESVFTEFSSKPINAVAFSKNSELISGKGLSNLIQVMGTTTQSVVNDLASGASSLYLKSIDLSSALSNYYSREQVDSLADEKLSKSANLSDLPSVSTARTNLGLGSLATQSSVGNAQITDIAYSKITGAPSNFTPAAHTHPVAEVTGLGALATLSSVGNAQITDVAYSKLSGVPSSFTPSAHNHSISEVTGLSASLASKLDASALPTCNANQTIIFMSPTGYMCANIAIDASQVSGIGGNYYSKSEVDAIAATKLVKSANLSDVASVSTARTNLGLGALSTLSTVGDSQITDVALAKVTGAGSLAALSSVGNAQITSVALAKVTGAGSLAALSSVGNAQITDVAYSKLSGVPSSFTPSAHNHSVSDITGLGSLATLSTVGNSQITDVALAKVTGAGSLAALSSVGNTQITDVALAKVTGAGSLAALSTVGNAQITDVAYSKITGLPTQVYATYSRSAVLAATTAGTKILWDTNGDISASATSSMSAGDFNCPVGGMYQIDASYNANAPAGGGINLATIRVNGVDCSQGKAINASGLSTFSVQVQAHCLKRCNLNEKISVTATVGANTNITANPTLNVLTIIKVAD